MGRTSSRAALELTESDRHDLERVAGSRTGPRRAVERTQILLRYTQGETITNIHRALPVSRPTVYPCIDKALAAGAAAGLKDTDHRPRAPVIGEPEKAFVLNLACQKPVIELLRALDAYYPPECPIRIAADKHSLPTSKETRAYLATRPNRFTCVHTPQHGAWCNWIERAFAKRARRCLRHSRAGSKEALKQRLLQGIDKMHAAPVVMRRRKYDRGLV